MKGLYFLRQILTPIMLTLITLSCCNDYDTANNVDNQELSEADFLVDSEEFATLQKVLRADRKKIALSYKSLSKEEKRKIDALQKEGSKLKGKKKVEMAMEISRILNIDYNARIKKISDAMHNCFKNTNISNVDLANAIRRRNLSTRSRNDDYYRELQYQSCLNQCEYSYTQSCRLCYSQYVEMTMHPQSNGGLEYDTQYNEKYSDCMSEAYFIRLDCLADCEFQK